jgi:hypothetical protein
LLTVSAKPVGVGLYLTVDSSGRTIFVADAHRSERLRGAVPLRKSSGIQTLATLGAVIVAAVTPQLPFAPVFGFQTMPAHFYPIIALIILAYVAAAEATKALFYRQNGKV